MLGKIAVKPLSASCLIAASHVRPDTPRALWHHKPRNSPATGAGARAYAARACWSAAVAAANASTGLPSRQQTLGFRAQPAGFLQGRAHARVVPAGPRQLLRQFVELAAAPQASHAGQQAVRRLAPEIRHEVPQHRLQHPAFVHRVVVQQDVRHDHAVGRGDDRRVAGGLALVVEPLRQDLPGSRRRPGIDDVPGPLAHDRPGRPATAPSANRRAAK